MRRHKHGYKFASLGHLHRLSGFDPAQVATGVLAQLANSDALHSATVAQQVLQNHVKTARYPPAIAPTIRNGSAPVATGSGNGASGASCDRSCSHAKNRTNARR